MWLRDNPPPTTVSSALAWKHEWDEWYEPEFTRLIRLNFAESGLDALALGADPYTLFIEDHEDKPWFTVSRIRKAGVPMSMSSIIEREAFGHMLIQIAIFEKGYRYPNSKWIIKRDRQQEFINQLGKRNEKTYTRGNQTSQTESL